MFENAGLGNTEKTESQIFVKLKILMVKIPTEATLNKLKEKKTYIFGVKLQEQFVCLMLVMTEKNLLFPTMYSYYLFAFALRLFASFLLVYYSGRNITT